MTADRWNGIETPEDLPREHVEPDLDTLPPKAPTLRLYVRPVTREQILAALRNDFIDCGAQRDPFEFEAEKHEVSK